MGVINQITDTNGTTHDVQGIHRVIMNNTSSTATAFVVSTATGESVTSLYDGLTIVCKNTKIASASGCTLNLNGLGAKRIWLSQGNGYCTTHWGLNQTYIFIYDATNTRWELQQGRDTDSNNYDRNRYNVAIKAGANAIVAGNIIVANSDGKYHHLKDGSVFDLKYPILYAAAAIEANGTGSNNYDCITFTVTTTQSITLTPYKPVYIACTCAWNQDLTYIPISATPLTQTLPTKPDNFVYILLGVAYSSTGIYLLDDHRKFMYVDSTQAPFTLETADYSIMSMYALESGYAPTNSHTHGNIQNGGTLQTNDITIANGDKIIVTDSSDSSKIARTSIAFDASTATQCLTKKGTWATFGTSNLALGTSSTTALKGDTKYAGASTAGGAATSAAKLTNTSKIGDTNKPVYFTASGVPSAISYTIDKSVPSTAVFTDNQLLQEQDTNVGVLSEILLSNGNEGSTTTSTSRKSDGLTFYCTDDTNYKQGNLTIGKVTIQAKSGTATGARILKLPSSSGRNQIIGNWIKTSTNATGTTYVTITPPEYDDVNEFLLITNVNNGGTQVPITLPAAAVSATSSSSPNSFRGGYYQSTSAYASVQVQLYKSGSSYYVRQNGIYLNGTDKTSSSTTYIYWR